MISMYCNSWYRYRKLSSLRELKIPTCKKYKIILHQSQICCSFRRNVSNSCYPYMFRIQLIFQYDTLSECKNTHTHTHTHKHTHIQFASIHTCSLQTHLHRNAYIHTYVHIEHIYTCVHTNIHAEIHAYMHNACIACIHTNTLHTSIYEYYVHTNINVTVCSQITPCGLVYSRVGETC